MSGYCVECNKKIGLFKKAVERVYCSVECRDAAARAEQAAPPPVLSELPPPVQPSVPPPALSSAPPPSLASVPPSAQRTSSLPPLGARVSEAPVVVESGVVQRGTLLPAQRCPKCSAAWAFVQGGGSGGRDHGACRACGFETDFLAISQCPHCRAASWVIESAEEARCPRCKTRQRSVAS